METARFKGFCAVVLVLPLTELAVESARESGATQGGVFGSAATETLRGTSRNDSFYGNGGRDTMVGGAGDDRYIVGDAQRIVEAADEGTDTALYTDQGTYYLPANVENIVISNNANRVLNGRHIKMLGDAGGPSAVGNVLANWMVGSAANNELDGRAGNDVLTGGAGRDSFAFGLGYDRDRVADFDVGVDKIRLVSGFRDFDEVRAALTDTAAGVQLRTGLGDTLTLSGRRAADLVASDFEFTVDLSRYTLTFRDEFDGFSRFDGRTGEDGGTWRTRMAQGDGTIIGGGEAAILADVSTKGLGLDPFSVKEGVLTISASWRPDLATQFGGREFVSGVITTEGTHAQLYGYFEARMKVGDVAGGFPAFWLLPADHSWPPEIDVMEQLGRQADMIYQMGNWVQVDPNAFNTYALEWTADRLAWFVNGEMTHVVYNHSQHKPMYVILDYNLGGSWAGDVARPAAPGGSAGNVQIDYVRAYELNAGEAGRQPSATAADGAPRVTYSMGPVAVGGVPAGNDRWQYLADTSGKLIMLPEDFNFASQRGWQDLRIENDRPTDAYSARNSNGWTGLNLQLSDPDGGVYSFDSMTLAELHLGGAAASSVSLSRSQYGLVETGAGHDTVTISSPQIWITGRSADFEVRAGGGNDLVTGWSTGAAGARLLAYGEAGEDILIGGTGNDVLSGGDGNDRLTGGNGADSFLFRRGETGSDIITDFTAGQDRLLLSGYNARGVSYREVSGGTEMVLGDQLVLVPGASAAALAGSIDWTDVDTILFGNNAGGDLVANPILGSTIVGGAGATTFWGGLGNNVFTGGAGDDIFRSGSGVARMTGGNGHDQYVINNMLDEAIELPGGGTDTAWVAVNGWHMGAEIEIGRLSGGATMLFGNGTGGDLVANPIFGSTIVGGESDTTFWGGSGGDAFTGGAGNDIFRSGSGVTSMVGGTGNDQYVIGSLTASIVEKPGQGIDTAWLSVSGWTNFAHVEIVRLAAPGAVLLFGSSGDEDLVANPGAASTINGNGGSDTLWGSGFADTLNGGAGDDIMRGQGGADAMAGGTGNDQYVVFDNAATITEFAGEGYDIAYFVGVGTFNIGNDVEEARLVANGTGLVGNGLANLLSGNSSGLGSTLDGAGGDDIIFGTAAEDTFVGGFGDDTLYSQGGADRFVYDAPGWGIDQIGGFSATDGAKLRFLAGSGVTDFSQINLNTAGGNTQVNHANGVILVFGVSLTSSDFLFG